MNELPPGPERDGLQAEIEKEYHVARRMFIGRDRKGQSVISLCDTLERERIRICVDSEDNPLLEILDPEGKVTWSIPPREGT